jgi:pimeloyl-ACP methyl ester carboxylesterase
MKFELSFFCGISRTIVLALLVVAACDAQRDPIVDADHSTGTVISADGVPIQFDDYGAGSPALVLIHGWSCDRTYWAEQVGPLSAKNRVVTVDLGGHGESGLGRDDWTIAAFGADVAAVVEHLDLDSVVLVGHSMGGDVIFQAARLLPDKVKALVMVDTYKRLGAWNSDAEIDEIVAEFGADFPGVTEKLVRSFFPANADPEIVDKVAYDMASAPPDVALSAIRSSFRHAREMPKLIDEVGIPIVAVNPDDAPTNLESMGQFGVKVEIMSGVGHFLMIEDPESFNELLLSKLNGF